MAKTIKNQFTRPNKRRYNQRIPETRKMKARIFVATEGSKTEPKYIQNLQNIFRGIKFELVRRDSHSAPTNVLKKLKETIRNDLKDKGRNGARDKAFLIIDDDNRSPAEFKDVLAWRKSDKGNNFIVLSKPCFELWLLYHFEDCSGIQTKKECIKKLKTYLPSYEKDYKKKFSETEISDAMNRALAKCDDFDKAFSFGACSGMGAFVKLLYQLQE